MFLASFIRVLIKLFFLLYVGNFHLLSVKQKQLGQNSKESCPSFFTQSIAAGSCFDNCIIDRFSIY